MNNTDDGEAANKKKGVIIIAVIVGGAIYVGLSPFIGAMLVPHQQAIEPQSQVQHVSQAPQAQQVQQLPVTPLSRTVASTASTSSTASGHKHSDILDALRSTTSAREPMSKRFADSLSSPDAPKVIQIPDGLISSASVKPPATAQVTAPVVVANADYERSLKNVTSLCEARKNEAGLKAADEFLATLNRDPSALPNYKIVTIALAMQMAADSQQKARAQSYGVIGLREARDHDDYFMERIEPLYYALQGSRVNFAKAESLIEQCQAELAGGTRQKLPELGRQVMTATETLPDHSFYRLQARVMNAYGEFVQSENPAAAIEAFQAIKQTARAAGDQSIAKKCDLVVTLIKKQQK